MLADFCWNLKRDKPETSHKRQRKYNKLDKHISLLLYY